MNRRMWMVLAGLSLAVVILALWQVSGSGGRDEPAAAATVSEQDLTAVADARVFFAHQSVGENLIDALPAVYGDSPAPTIVETRTPPEDAAYFAHAYVGTNGDPVGKLRDFEALMAGGYGEEADVAFVKLCYIDVTSGTDAQALFTDYKETMARLEQRYPAIKFLYLTVPLTTEPAGAKTRVKSLLGRTDANSADNAVREQFNARMRAEYGGTGRLFDIAAMESTDPDGQRITSDDHYALYPGYSTDGGHLTPEAAQWIAGGLVTTVAVQLA